VIGEFYRRQIVPRLTADLVFAGVEFKSQRGKRWRAACPLHGGDNPQAFSVDAETLLWNCFTHCGGGDAVDFVMKAEGLDFVGAVTRLAELAGVSYLLRDRLRAHSGLPPVRAVIPRMPPAPPKRHPHEEIAAFWNQCAPVTEDVEVSGYLRKRCIDPATVEERDLARAVPKTGGLPWWARYCGRAWNDARQQFRLVVKMFAATGRLESVHARALYPQEPKGRDKAAAVAGASLKGLVMADALGQRMLEASALGDGSPASQLVASCGLWVMEGTPDFLTRATDFSEAAEDAPAVLAIFTGCWTEQIAARVPHGTVVAIDTHADAAGDRFAQLIADSLAGRCRLKRSREATAS
jgi:CHC2-type zinc finger protein